MWDVDPVDFPGYDYSYEFGSDMGSLQMTENEYIGNSWFLGPPCMP